MIPFDFRLFGRLIYIACFKSRDTDAPLTVRRALDLFLGILGFLMLEIGNFLFLSLDEVFFPAYRRVKIGRPIFIIGNPRSGTTFLHRVLSLDEERFVGFRMWEILFPSIIQKKLLDLVAQIDHSLGQPLRRLIQRTEKRILGKFIDMHPTGLLHWEEDEMLLLHCFSSLYLVFFFPFYDLLKQFAMFDQKVPPARRAQIMEFYRGCILRQAYVRGPQKAFLSKNPMFSCKVESLRLCFPGCRFVYMMRSPLEAILSMLSEGHATCVFAKPNQAPSAAFQQSVYETAKVFYHYPLERSDGNSESSLYIINYHELVVNPAATIVRLYADLGIEMTAEFRSRLRAEEEKSRKYESLHRYSLDQFSIPIELFRKDFADIMERFVFPDGASGGSSEG